MNPKEFHRQRALSREEKRLNADSFQLYLKLLERLLQVHRKYGFLKPLSDALRQRDFGKLYAQTELLLPQQYGSADECYVAAQFSHLIKKYPWEPKLLGFDPERTAMSTFDRGEKRCGRINIKFELLKQNPARDKFREEGKKAMAWIRSVLGRNPNYPSIFRQCEFGQGASLGIHGDATHVIRKLSDEQEWSVGPGAIHHAFGGLMRNHHYFETLLPQRYNSDGRVTFSLDYEAAFSAYVSRLSIVEHNKISFVPKTAKTHRSIAVEPVLSGFVQKGIDIEMRRKLLNFGIDLSDQSLNQRMAREGSCCDDEESYVTIDLENASNSNALGPVAYLYPAGWVDLFNRTRSHYYEHAGAVKRYRMLCSMGNGFCFPVETLTFAAICHACDCGVPGKDFSVYGDDIIVRKKYAARVLSMLKHYGFRPNARKTFLEGPFRESCGADWFNGEDIRPFTLDFALDSIESFFKYFNLSRRSDRTSQFFASVRPLVMSRLPLNYRFFRPFKGQENTGIDSMGDEHLHSPHCKYVPFEKGPFANGRWEWQELHQIPVPDSARMFWWKHEPWLMGVALRGTPSRSYGELGGLPEVTYRRKTRAKIVHTSYASTSNWLPPGALLLGERA